MERKIAVRQESPEGGRDRIASVVGGRQERDDLAAGGERGAGWRRGPAGLVLFRRCVVDGHCSRAGRFHLPGRDAGNDAADDAADTRDVLVALSVPKLQAAREERVTALRPAPARGVVAPGLAEREPAAAAVGTGARGIAIHVVARTTAVRGVVGDPPAAHNGVRWTEVVPAD